MHPRALHVVEAGNGPRHLTLQAAAITRRFHELAGAKALLTVKNLKTQIAVSRGNTCAGQTHARISQVGAAYQQGATVGLHLVVNAALLQQLDHLASIVAIQAVIQRPIIRLLRPQHHRKANRYAGGQTDQQAKLTQHWQLRQIIQKGQPHKRLALTLWLVAGRRCIAGGIHGHFLDRSGLDSHFHDVFVGGNHPVAHLGHGLKGY